MTTNQYDTPAQAQFVDTYVPIPFQEMMQAGAAKQHSYDDSQNRADGLVDAYKNIKVAPVDMATKNMRIRQINDEITKLVDEHPDLGSYEFKRKLNRYQRDISTDPWWTSAQANVKPYEELVKSIGENRSKNVSYNTRAQNEYFKLLQKEGTEGLLQRGINNGSIMDPGATEYADFNAAIDKSLNHVKASGATNQYYDKDGMKVLSGREGVALDTLKKGVGAERDSFFASKEGKNFVNMVADSTGGNLTEELLNKAYDDLVDQRAKKFVHGKKENKVDYDAGYDKKQQDAKYSEFDLTGGATESHNKIPDYNKYGETSRSVGLLGSVGQYSGSITGMQYKGTGTENTVTDIRKNPEMAKRIGTTQGKFGLSKDETIKSINTNLNYWLGPQFNNYNVIRPADAKSLSERYSSNLGAVQLYDDKGKLYQGKDKDKLLEGNQGLQIGSLIVNPSSKGEGAYLTGTLTKADKSVVQVNVALPRHMRGAGKLAAQLDKLKNEAVLTGKTQKTQENLGNGYTSETEIEYRESKTDGGFKMEPVINQYTKDSKGKIIDKAENIPYEDYKTMIEEQLMNQLNGVNKK